MIALGLCLCLVAGPKYLVLDARVVERTEGAHLRLGTVEKDPRNPLFRQDRPWEPRIDNMYANVLFDGEEGIYKMWYSPFIIDEATTKTTDEEKERIGYHQARVKLRGREMGICYGTSRDGIAWEKPNLGLVEFDGSKANNLILRVVHGAGIRKDPADPDPARRYKLFGKDGEGRVAVAFSRDGLRWSPLIPCPQIEARADTHNNFLWVDGMGKYVGFTRLFYDRQRIVGRTESADFTRWTKATEVLRGLAPHLQTYAMPVFEYANVFLGLLMVFDTKTDTVTCELTWSPDTIEWNRVCPGTPLIDRGPAGSHEWGCIYGAAYPILRDGELRLYYSGNDGPHSNWRKGSFCLAHLRPDGFACYEPVDPSAPAAIVTRPVRCAGSKLRVSADAAGGSLRAEVIDADGLSLAACEPVAANVTDGAVSWRDGRDLAPLEGKPIRLRFELRAAKLYAFGFGD
ncbi:MAG: hypothetical protein JXP34_00030 [Planctomycetes bacterium]|nr:hypothetical protein [Planctomycetota bacterium]